ncbi:hypothetical protein Tco_0787441 [Tanacetum coccineum]
MAGEDDQNINNQPPNPPPPTQQAPHTVSTIKLPILKKGEYDIWAMKMEHYLAHTDYPVWEVIQNGNGPVSISTDTQGQIKILPPKSAEEILARERERKARTTLLMALPEDHLARFHNISDAKEMWDAIKTRFGGNAKNTGYKGRDQRTGKQEQPKALLTIDAGVIDWSGQAEEEEEDHALMAFNSNSSSNEVQSCSDECVASYNKLKQLYDEQREQLGDASIEIQAYTQALKKVEAQLVAHQQSQLWYEEKIRFMKIDLDDKTDVLTYHKKLLAEAEKEKEDLKAKVEKWHNSSKNLNILLNSQMSAKDKAGLGVIEDSLVNDRYAEGMHAVPPPMTGIYIPSGPDKENSYDTILHYGPKNLNCINPKTGLHRPCASTVVQFSYARPVCTARPSINTVRPSVSTARPSISTARPVCTARPSISTVRPVCTTRPSISTARPVCTARPSISTARHVCTAKPSISTVGVYASRPFTQDWICKLQLADATGVHNLSDAKIYVGLAILGTLILNIRKVLAIFDQKRFFCKLGKGVLQGILSIAACYVGGALRIKCVGSAQTQLETLSQPVNPYTIHIPTHQSPPHSHFNHTSLTISINHLTHHSFLPLAFIYEAPLPEGNTSGSAEASIQLKELMVLVPSLVTRVTSLEKELKVTKQTLGNVVLKLVKKVKSLEKALKRKSKKVYASMHQRGEEPEVHGEDNRILMMINTGSTSLLLVEGEGKLKYGEGLYRRCKQIHLDKMLAKRVQEEQELSEQQLKRKVEVQKAAQFYTEEDWDTIRAKLEANTSFGAILKDFLRDELVELYRLVIKKYGANRPEEMYDKVLWGDLKTMFDSLFMLMHLEFALKQKIINWTVYYFVMFFGLTLDASTVYYFS